MKNYSIQRSALTRTQQTPRLRATVLVVSLVLAFFSVAPRFVSHAQRFSGPIKVSNISSQANGGGTVVTIAADNALSRAQTWHDDEGYHVVLPNTVSADSLKAVKGVKVRSVGSSLEVVLQTKPNARVSVQSGNNQLSLAVDGKLIPRQSESRTTVQSRSPEERQLFEDYGYKRQQVAGPTIYPTDLPPAPNVSDNSQSNTAIPQLNSDQILPTRTDVNDAPAEVTIEEEDGFLASIFSGTSVLIVLALGIFGILVSRKLRSKQAAVVMQTVEVDEDAEWDDQVSEAQLQLQTVQPASLARTSEASSNGSSNAVARMPVAGPTSLFGAYRIDQEVGKLIFGQPHRIDVLASRAIDDRRAIETSLIKGVNSPELDEAGKRRAREALEEYGFVARQCASLLLAPAAFDRTSAARSLGEIKSEAALPFLLESLYDSEPIVRNQAVLSIGELKMPSAIGALLDIARTHPDVPSSLLSKTLSACSVEGLDFFDAIVPDVGLLGGGDVGSVIQQITQLEVPAMVESLPEVSDDENLSQALTALDSSDVEERSEALKTLVQFRVQSAVEAIARVARRDSEATIRSLAISSLGTINHESVFAAVLIGMADESREVRAAAARSLNRLSFDRAEAYVRVIESGDDETIREVAKACIQSGIVSQNLDRLTSSDHRQAYETFTLICLLARARMNEPVLDAIHDHPRNDVRLKAVHLLACTGEPEIFEQLRELAVKEGLSEAVKTAVLEAMYKLDQARAAESESFESLPPVGESSNPLDVIFDERILSPEMLEGDFVFNDEHASAGLEFQKTEDTSEVEAQSSVQSRLDEYEL